LAFSVVGGNVHQPTAPAFDGIFVSTVEPGSPAEKNGLKRGDEVIILGFSGKYLEKYH
jgi:S1-C subfamily serine protease